MERLITIRGWRDIGDNTIPLVFCYMILFFSFAVFVRIVVILTILIKGGLSTIYIHVHFVASLSSSASLANGPKQSAPIFFVSRC